MKVLGTIVMYAVTLFGIIFMLYTGRCNYYDNRHDFTVSWDWDEEAPFDAAEIDTVVVIGLKDGCVKWGYRSGDWNVSK